MEESCQVGMSVKQRGRRDSHAGRDYPERLCSLQSWRASRPDLTVPRGTWADLIGDTALSKKLAYKLLQVPFKMTFFLRFHNEILAATYREKNEGKAHPITLVPTHQPLTSPAFASTVESVCWHCFHQRAGCLKYHCSCTASAHLSQSYNCS